MADAIGSRNIWDSLDRLQSNSGDSSKSDESRSRKNASEESKQKGQNRRENKCAQRLQFDSPDSEIAHKRRKTKPREPVSLLATMQKKLKINPLNLQHKASGPVLDAVQVTADHERPLDLSTRCDDSTSVSMPEIPLDLSLKRESENSLLSCLSFPAYGASGFKTEETLCITNRANQCGGSISISKPFAILPCPQKKVSPVRPIIGGKPVVTDSNGNVPQCTLTDTISKRNVFSVISVPTTLDKFMLNSSSDTDSNLHQLDVQKSGFKAVCGRTSDSPVSELNAGENFAYSSPIVSVIDYCSNELVCTGNPPVTASCSSLSNNMCVPDLVRSALGQYSQNGMDVCSSFPRETCLNIPTYKFQKKLKTVSKKASKASLNLGLDKRKCVPLAEVRPSCLLRLSPAKPTQSSVTSETLAVSDAIHNSVTTLSTVLSNELAKSSLSIPAHTDILSNPNPTEQALDSSGSPPKLSTFSPVSKSSGSCSSDNMLLSPQMPLLSPLAFPQLSHPAITTSTVHSMDHPHPIYAFSSCCGDSESATSRTDTKSSVQFSGSLTCASTMSEHVQTNSEIQAGVTLFTTMLQSLISSSRTTQLTSINAECVMETGIHVKDMCTDLTGCMKNRVHDVIPVTDPLSPYFKPEKRNVLESNSASVNAFMVNSEFAKDVHKKSKLNFPAVFAFDFEACASATNRPSKDMILRTKYYKLIAPRFGFPVGTSKDPAELVLQHKSPTKSNREIDSSCRDQKGAKHNKLGTPEQVSPSTNDAGPAKAKSLIKTSGKNHKPGQLDVKPCSNDECSVGAGTSRGQPDIVSSPKMTRSSKRKSNGYTVDERGLHLTPVIVSNSKPEVEIKRRKFCSDTVASTCANTSPTSLESNIKDGSKMSLNIKSESSAAVVNTDLCSEKLENRLAGKQKSSSLKKKAKLNICEQLLTDVSSNKETKEINRIKSEVSELQNPASDVLHVQPSPNSRRTRNRFDADIASESCDIISDRCDKDTSSKDFYSGSEHTVSSEGKSKGRKVTSARKASTPDTSVDRSSDTVPKTDKKLKTKVGGEGDVSQSQNEGKTEERAEIKMEVEDDESQLQNDGKTEERAEIKMEVEDDESQSQNDGKTEEKVEVKIEVDDDESQSQNEGNDELSESSQKKSRHTSARQSRSLLRELANSDGYVAEKRTPSRSDNLFIDSRYLTREERSIQMQLMRITKLEVKEEWSKVKEKKESTKMRNCSQTKPEHKEPAKGKPELCEAVNREQSEMSESNILPKEKKKLMQKSKNKSSSVIHDNKGALKRVNERNKKLAGPVKSKKYSSLSACKSVRRRQKLDHPGWMSRCMKKSTKKCNGRFRCRWKSGIWKKKSKLSPKSKVKSEKIKLSMGQKLHHSLTVDVDLQTSSRMSLSPCSGISSKFSPCSTIEKTNTRDDDVISMASSVTESSFPRRTIPAEVKKMVSSHATGETVLHRAARLGYTDVALWCCMARYVDVNAKDYAGYTPLHETLLHSNVAIARYLIHYGADLNSAAERRGGTRPLHEAVDCNATEMVRLLLSAGADINLTTYSGKTVQDVAHNPNMKEFLKAYMADINGGSTETEWHFSPSWDVSSDNDSTELGMDLLAAAPDDMELDDHIVTFQCSDKPFVPSYLLRIHKEDMPRSYMFLCDVLRRLKTEKSQFLCDYPDVVVERIAQEYLFSQIVATDFSRQHNMDEIKMKCDEQFIDILLVTSQLQRVLDIEVVSINSCKSRTTE